MRRAMVLTAAVAAAVGTAMVFAWLYCSTASQMAGRAATVADYVICTVVLTLLGMPFVGALYDMTEEA